MMTLPTPLITATALAERLAAAEPTRVFDASFDLTDPEAGRRAFDAGHLPGAQYLDLNRDLADHAAPRAGRPRGRHPLPAREAFANTIGRLGVDEATPVVLYDRSGGMYAARAWWMLRWLGHREVTVLDGGWSAWLAAGGATETAAGPVTPRAYRPGNPLVSSIDADALQRLQGLVHQVVVDDSVRRYVLSLLQATRTSSSLRLGASPRSGLMVIRAAQARALVHGRSFVLPDDIKAVAVPVMRHRLTLSTDAELDGLDVVAVVGSLLDRLPVLPPTQATTTPAPAPR